MINGSLTLELHIIFTANKKLLKDSINIDISKNEKVYLPMGKKKEITHTGNVNLFVQDTIKGVV